MGLVYKKLIGESGLLGLWEITETLEALLLASNLSDFDQINLAKKLSTKRKRESLAVRCLVNQMLESDMIINHDEDGKPFLESSDYYISVSHSEKYALTYLNKEKPVGTDIQKVKPDIGKGIDFILNDGEQLWVDKADFILINILWSAKESIYKFAGIKDLDSRNQISVKPFQAKSEGIITASFDHKTTEAILIHYEVFEDYILTRTL